MKKSLKLIYSIALLICVAVTVSCAYGIQEGFGRKAPVEKRAKNLLDAGQIELADSNNFSFILISDVHFGAKLTRHDDAFFTAVQALEKRPDFCVVLGDVAEHGLEEEYVDFNNVIVAGLQALGIETYCTVGNHDLYNSGWESYSKYNFPYTSFYKATGGNCSFYFIDSASCTIGQPQFNALENSFLADDAHKFIFTHVPLHADDTKYFVMQDTDERNELISLFAQNNVEYFFAGHIHDLRSTDFGAFFEENVPAYLAQKGFEVCTVKNSPEFSVTNEVIYFF